MRTTINLPDGLVNEALRVSQCKTKTILFTMALQNIITQRKVAELKKFKGAVDLTDINLDLLRQRG